MQQGKPSKDSLQHKSIRYRKISMSGGAVLSFMNNQCSKQPIKGVHLQFPILEQRVHDPQFLKHIEEEYIKKNNPKGVKSLLRAYDEIRKKSAEEEMNGLGLGVIKIQQVAKASPEKKVRASKRDLSIKKFDLGKIKNRNSVSPNQSKYNSAREKINSEEDQFQLKMDSTELTDSTTFFSNKRKSDNPSSLSSPPKNNNKNLKMKEYLYKRLQGTEKNMKEQLSYIYEKRIKSYLQFLWKNQFAHNIYISLDLKFQELNNRPKKLKAFVAPGNNGAMVRGLIRRRFWWQLVDERTPDCDFVWTQIKVNAIFQNQKKTVNQKQKWKPQQEQEKKKKKIKQCPNSQQFNSKLMNQDDCQAYKRYFEQYQGGEKERQYSFKAQKSIKQLIFITPPDQTTLPLQIHNHLPFNFYLGNKKALFHNLRQYYSLIDEDVYEYIPLTFHIRKGLKDPEYAKFVDYYKKRAKLIKIEEKEEEEEGVINKSKTRNIWIVKPGQNSNRGNGITVIDQIYQLNSIIKQGERQEKQDKTITLQHPDQVERTFIVQMYIDRPFLYNNRKFDIRHYLLITNFYGVLRAYWYEEGYIRTSSFEFNIDNFEPEIHLTNDAVQKKYPQYHKYEPYNKISYQEFQRYLDGTGKKLNFKSAVLPQMKKMATDAARSVATKISPSNNMNNFEIFGLDFMIDRHFRPWLIQINTNPCLQCACPLLDRIIPYMVEQSFKLSLDLAHPPPTHYPPTSRHLAPMISLDTFKYELIFDSQTEGELLRNIYRKAKGNLIDCIGQIQEDETFVDQGKEIKLDDYT